MYVLDATPLIYLGKADALEVLDSFDVVTTRRVYDEVVTRGKKAGASDARRVERYDLNVVEATENETYERLTDAPGLSDADVSVLALTDERDATAVMDERRGRTVANAEGIEVRGTAFLLLSAVKQDELKDDEAREILDGMVDAGWYCSTSFYAKTVSKLEELG
ncbi:MAG: DUF3368 domain-containing protein [Halobacteriales archaeon]|nr:DUF3368 domain-containing protein [Halobacteriales archaeon]